MAQMSDFLENAMINHVFRNTPYSQTATVYVALFSSDPTDAGTGDELIDATSPGYLRRAATFIAPTNGVTSNDADIVFPVATADWLEATHVATFDATSGGNMLMHKVLTTPVTVLNTNNFRIPLGSLTITLA